MRDNYDFGSMKGIRNPYLGRLKESITIRLDRPTVAYFKALADELGMPCQSLINLYLRDCVVSGRKQKRRGEPQRSARGSRRGADRPWRLAGALALPHS